MPTHLQQASDYEEVLAAHHRREEAERHNLEFRYPGNFQEQIALRPLIDDFLKNTKWFNHSKLKYNTLKPLMLKKVQGGGWHKKLGVYDDRVRVARHFIHLYGAD